MRHFLRFASSAVLGAAFVLVVGMLAIQSSGATTGAVFNLNNQVVAVTTPHIPYLQLVAIAVLGSVVTGVGLWFVFSKGIEQSATVVLGFAVGVIPLIIWSAILKAGRLAGEARAEALPPGVPGWALHGGGSGIVHVAVMVSVAALLLRFVSARSRSRDAENANNFEAGQFVGRGSGPHA